MTAITCCRTGSRFPTCTPAPSRWRNGGCARRCSGSAIRCRRRCRRIAAGCWWLFAFLTWIYRFTLFLGIAAIVYHFAVKILGIAMMMVEVGYFVAMPVVREALTWWRRRADIHLNARTALTAAAGLAIVLLLLLPWRSAVEAPALLKSQQHVDIFAPEFGARLARISVHEGDNVAKGAPLLQLASPDLDYRLGRARTEIEISEWQLGARGANAGAAGAQPGHRARIRDGARRISRAAGPAIAP